MKAHVKPKGNLSHYTHSFSRYNREMRSFIHMGDKNFKLEHTVRKIILNKLSCSFIKDSIRCLFTVISKNIFNQ